MQFFRLSRENEFSQVSQCYNGVKIHQNQEEYVVVSLKSSLSVGRGSSRRNLTFFNSIWTFSFGKSDSIFKSWSLATSWDKLGRSSQKKKFSTELRTSLSIRHFSNNNNNDERLEKFRKVKEQFNDFVFIALLFYLDGLTIITTLPRFCKNERNRYSLMCLCSITFMVNLVNLVYLKRKGDLVFFDTLVSLLFLQRILILILTLIKPLTQILLFLDILKKYENVISTTSVNMSQQTYVCNLLSADVISFQWKTEPEVKMDNYFCKMSVVVKSNEMVEENSKSDCCLSESGSQTSQGTGSPLAVKKITWRKESEEGREKGTSLIHFNIFIYFSFFNSFNSLNRIELMLHRSDMVITGGFSGKAVKIIGRLVQNFEIYMRTSGSFVCNIFFNDVSISQSVSVSPLFSVVSLFRITIIQVYGILFLILQEGLLGLHTRSHTRIHFSSYFSSYQCYYRSQFWLSSTRSGKDRSSLVNNLHNGLKTLLILSGDVEKNPGPLPCNRSLLLMSQNCRGLNNLHKLKQIMMERNRKVKNDLYVMVLQESYLIDDSTIHWYGNYAFTKADSTHSAGCITFFSDTVKIIEKIDIDDKGHGHIVVVEGLSSGITVVCNIYAPVRSLVAKQVKFYEKLGELIDGLENKYILNEPDLIILGDFNLPFEVGMLHNVSEQARALTLSEYFSSLGLKDCWLENDDRVTLKGGQSRLDRILYRIGGSWNETFSIDWSFTNSDHCLLTISLSADLTRREKTRRIIALPTYILNSREDRLKIYNGLNEFRNMISESWDAHTKLEFLKMGLRTVVGECIKQKAKAEREELDSIQLELERKMIYNRTISLRAREENLKEVDVLFNRRNHILESRSSALAEKAKTRWFHEGEKANKYFLNMLRKRRAITGIDTLVTENGTTTNNETIKTEVSNFYKELYEKGGSSSTDEDFYQYIDKIPVEISQNLTKAIQKEELYQTLKSCNDSAPGPDGIPYSYYKYYWDFFGHTLVQAWNESLQNEMLPPSHRISILRLLPKEGKDLKRLTNWRPITLSNCDHKLITKCYATRLTNILKNYLHPNQTAYLPGKQIQDNLRLINIINKTAESPIIAALDAKKAFDSVTHDYIRKTLKEYGLDSFIPIFNILYRDQKVDIALNGDIINGYQIKNGVKQGDSLSCILFILCIDPLIRNIENNEHIGRIETPNYTSPKILAYADDVTCLIDTKRSLRQVFKEYERLSKASGLVLNADKTEILDRDMSTYSFKYMDDVYRIKGKSEAKINGIVFHCNEQLMQERNYQMLLEKINSALTAWATRRLSLLGKILIYKTFGLSQITYVLTIIELSQIQYKYIDQMFQNYLWGRDLYSDSKYSRIGWQNLCRPIERGGFGMLKFQDVVEGIRCRQLGKMFSNEYTHPLKHLLLNENKSFASWTCLKESADTVARIAHGVLLRHIIGNIRSKSTEEIISDNLLLKQLGEIETVFIVKAAKRQGEDATRLIYQWGCDTLKEIVVKGQGNRRVMAICKRIITAKYLRIVKALVRLNTIWPDGPVEKFKLAGKNYKLLPAVTSKEFRMLGTGMDGYNRNKLGEPIEAHTSKEYFVQLKRLISTKHKNTLLRVWNGDCLSRSRLVHFGIVDTNRCPHCNDIDTPEHMLLECAHAKRVWELIMRKVPKSESCTLIQYAIGINDTRSKLMLKAELLKNLMHFRELEPDEIVNKAIAYLKAVCTYDRDIATW